MLEILLLKPHHTAIVCHQLKLIIAVEKLRMQTLPNCKGTLIPFQYFSFRKEQ